MASVVVFGSINLDLVVRVTRAPEVGETVSGGDLAQFPGGKGANQAVAAARQGAEVAMIGRVGDDAFGPGLRTALAKQGVDVTGVRTWPGPSGTALVTVEEGGANRIIISPGANGSWRPSDVDGFVEVLQSTKVLLLQLEVPLPAVIRAAAIGHAAGVMVALDPAPARPLPGELLRYVDCLLPNLGEAQALLGPGAPSAQADVAAELGALGPRTVVLKLGEQGILGWQAGRAVHLPPHRVRVMDTTAAGDAASGAFAAAMARGEDFGEALRYANAAGALAVTGLGAQPSLPGRREVRELLSREP